MKGKNSNNVMSKSEASRHGLKSMSLIAIANMALIAILLNITNPTKAQKILTKKEYETILDKAVESQGEI